MTVTELVGFGVGVIGIPLSELYQMDVETLDSAIQAWCNNEERHYRTSWEQTRFLAHCVLTPYSRKNLRPTDIIRFEWDTAEKKGKGQRATPEDIERIKRRFGIL